MAVGKSALGCKLSLNLAILALAGPDKLLAVSSD